MIDFIRELPAQIAAVAGDVYTVAPAWVLVALFALGAALFLAGAAGIILKRRTRRPIAEPATPRVRHRDVVRARQQRDRAEREAARVAHPEYDTGVAVDLTERHAAALARLDAEFERALTLRGQHARRAMERL